MTCSKVRCYAALDYEYLDAKRGPLHCKFDLPRIIDARNASTPRELRDNERFRNLRTVLHVVPKMISSLPIFIFTTQAQFISSLRKLSRYNSKLKNYYSNIISTYPIFVRKTTDDWRYKIQRGTASNSTYCIFDKNMAFRWDNKI